MDDYIVARVIHVLAVLFWIGGVGFVTLVVMPMLQADETADARLARFQQFESRFAWQARIWVVLTGASGLWMCWRADLWSRFTEPGYWWMHAMVCLWVIFAAMLFVIEPFFMDHKLARSAAPAKHFAKMVRMHQILLLLSIVTMIGAVGGSHGLF